MQIKFDETDSFRLEVHVYVHYESDEVLKRLKDLEAKLTENVSDLQSELGDQKAG